MTEKLKVGVLGAGRWAQMAHVPGWKRDPRVELVAVCDPIAELASQMASKFDIPESLKDWEALVSRQDIDVIDIVTPSHTHFELASHAIENGKHVLCEKPVARDFRDTLSLAKKAKAKKLKTKLGFTFRFSPGVRYARTLLDEGYVGRPFIFNGYEQNSQFLDPKSPLRQVLPPENESDIQLSSLEGYGAPIIDIAHWWVGTDLASVVGTMRNFIPERAIRGQKGLQRINIDDGDIFLGEFTNGAIGTIQSSYVTVGNYPGIEARIYGETGAIICRLVEENGIAETIKVAKPDAVEFQELEIPQEYYPQGGHAKESWRSLFYANLIQDFVDEIRDGGDRNQGNFEDGAWVQEVINAVDLSVRQRRWIDLPLDAQPSRMM